MTHLYLVKWYEVKVPVGAGAGEAGRAEDAAAAVAAVGAAAADAVLPSRRSVLALQ